MVDVTFGHSGDSETFKSGIVEASCGPYRQTLKVVKGHCPNFALCMISQKIPLGMVKNMGLVDLDLLSRSL
jgi:hypothetical protein